MEYAQADESVAVKFTRVMNATPSRWGLYSDLMLAAASAAMLVFAGFLVASRTPSPAAALPVVLGIALLPFVVSSGISLALGRSSRRRVVAWVSALPFEFVNLNALLAGVGDTLEVVFCEPATLPKRAELQPKLEEVSDDLLIVAERPEQRLLAIRLGVIDSKRLPLRSNYERWVRLCTTVDRVLVPLHKSRPIERIVVV